MTDYCNAKTFFCDRENNCSAKRCGKDKNINDTFCEYHQNIKTFDDTEHGFIVKDGESSLERIPSSNLVDYKNLASHNDTFFEQILELLKQQYQFMTIEYLQQLTDIQKIENELKEKKLLSTTLQKTLETKISQFSRIEESQIKKRQQDPEFNALNEQKKRLTNTQNELNQQVINLTTLLAEKKRNQEICEQSIRDMQAKIAEFRTRAAQIYK